MDKYGIIGFPLSHSFSPHIHNLAFNNLSINANYEILSIKPNVFESEIKKLKKSDYRGFNITIPYKQKIIPFIDEIDPLAKKVNAVNTILKKDNKWFGYNTDIYGFLKPLEKSITSIKSVLVIGAGGAASAVCFSLLRYRNISLLSILNRSVEKAQRLAYQLKKEYDLNINAGSLEVGSDLIFDLIINTTNVGMGNLIDINPFNISNNSHKKTVVYDLIYNPECTQFLKLAHHNGLKTINGLEMLIGQAMKSFSIWTNREFPPNLLKNENFYKKE